MDVWFPGNEGKTRNRFSSRARAELTNRRQPSRALANGRGRANRDVRCQSHRAIGERCGLDIAFYGPRLQRTTPGLRTAAAAELRIRWATLPALP